MKYFTIGSGSSGNGVTYHNEILIDVGLSYKKLKPYMRNVKYVFLTHEHGDHFNLSTIRSIVAERPDIVWIVPNYLLEKVKLIGLKRAFVVEAGKKYKVGDYRIQVDELYHDVPNVAYHIFNRDNYKILHATDTGKINHIVAENYDLYALEWNHDEVDILERIISKVEDNLFAYEIRALDTHLSFQQTEEYFESMKGEYSELLKLHISSYYLEKERIEGDLKDE